MTTSYQFCPTCHKLRSMGEGEVEVYPLTATAPHITFTTGAAVEPRPIFSSSTAATAGSIVYPMQIEFCTCPPEKKITQ